MCTWIVEKTPLRGSAKGAEGWFPVAEAAVYYDHPYHAPFDHALTIDVARDPAQPDHRVRLELERDSAERLVTAIQAALAGGTNGHGDPI